MPESFLPYLPDDDDGSWFFLRPPLYTISSTPYGPFTEPKIVYTINDMFYGLLARYYTPAIHPQFNNGRNELLVTYCLNYNACSQSSFVDGNTDPNFYQVKGVRIPYASIGL